MSPRRFSSALAVLSASGLAQSATDCSRSNVEWGLDYVPDSYKFDAAAGTTTFCYTLSYKQAFDTAAGECSPAGGQAQAVAKFGARFLSCFVNENAGLRPEEGTWTPAHSDEGYAEETMEGENMFNGDLWSSGLPAVGSSSTYCATFKRKLNLSAGPNTVLFATDGGRYTTVAVQGPECYLAPPETTTPPPPSSSTVPPPETTTPPPPSSTTVPPPETTPPPPPSSSTVPPPETTTPPPPPPTSTTVPPSSSSTVPPTSTTTTTITPEPSDVLVSQPEEVIALVPSASVSALPSAAGPMATNSTNVGAIAGASAGAGLLAAVVAAVLYRRRSNLANESQQAMAIHP